MRGLYSVACPVSVLGGGRAWIAPKLPLPSVALDSQNGSAAAAWVGGDVFTMYNVVAMEMTQLPMGLLWLTRRRDTTREQDGGARRRSTTPEHDARARRQKTTPERDAGTQRRNTTREDDARRPGQKTTPGREARARRQKTPTGQHPRKRRQETTPDQEASGWIVTQRKSDTQRRACGPAAPRVANLLFIACVGRKP
eukprot:gene12828-biopygen8179